MLCLYYIMYTINARRRRKLFFKMVVVLNFLKFFMNESGNNW